ncbi:hypothetical protein QN346_21455, partial [Undibacterium sp. 5I1]|nr:hypothetical protein [Undibacterium sp. 5I1]
GHDGGAGTLHANSLGDVPARLEALGALAGMSQAAVELEPAELREPALTAAAFEVQHKADRADRLPGDGRGLLVALPVAVQV